MHQWIPGMLWNILCPLLVDEDGCAMFSPLSIGLGTCCWFPLFGIIVGVSYLFPGCCWLVDLLILLVQWNMFMIWNWPTMITISHEEEHASNYYLHIVECLQGPLSRKSAGYIIIANAQDFLEPQFPICELKIIDLRQYGIAVWFMCCGILLVQICSIESYLPTYTNMLFSSCSVIESIINDQPNPAILRLRLTTSHSSELFFLPSP